MIHLSTLKASQYRSQSVAIPRIKKKLNELLGKLNSLPIAMQESARTLLKQAVLDLQDHLDTYEDTFPCALQEELFSGLSALERLTREICDASGSAQEMRTCWDQSRLDFLSSLDPRSRLPEDDSSGPTALGQNARQAADQALSTTAAVKGVLQSHIKTLNARRETSHDRTLLDRVVGPLQIGGISQDKKKDNKGVGILRRKILHEVLHEIQMSSPASLHFPDAVTMKKSISNHPLLKTNYYKEKGITQAIAEIAAKRFADSDRVEKGVKVGTMLLINDLQTGKDGFTGEALPDLGKLGLSRMVWADISTSTEAALLDCAKKV